MWVMARVWAGSWLILGAAGLLPDTLAAAIGVLAFMGVFAFGETLLQPTVPAIYNDLASDHNRGRYNAINSAAFQGGAIAGPIVAGLLLDQGCRVLIAVMVAGCLGIGVLARCSSGASLPRSTASPPPLRSTSRPSPPTRRRPRPRRHLSLPRRR